AEQEEPERWLDLAAAGYPGVSVRVGALDPNGWVTITGVRVLRDEGVRASDLRVPLERVNAAISEQVALEVANDPAALQDFSVDRRAKADELAKTLLPGEAPLPLLKPPKPWELRLKILKTQRYPDEFYARVAALYRRLIAAGEPPAPALAQANGVAKATVHRWIQEARSREKLPPGKKGRAG